MKKLSKIFLVSVSSIAIFAAGVVAGPPIRSLLSPGFSCPKISNHYNNGIGQLLDANLLHVNAAAQKAAFEKFSGRSDYFGCTIESVEISKINGVILVKVSNSVDAELEKNLFESFYREFGGKAYFY